MQALSKTESKAGIWMTDVPIPSLERNEVMIEVDLSSICGTDVHIFNWDAWSQSAVPVPMVLGHEYFGTVSALGQDVGGFSIGDRVTGEGHIICGHCRNCRGGRYNLCRNTLGVGVNRPGAFARYLAIPAFNVIKLPAFVTDEVAAVLDPFGNAVHLGLTFDVIGENVLIIGAGPIGIMTAAVCRHVGARNVVITDINEYRLGLAKLMKVGTTVNPEKEHLPDIMSALDIREGFDVGLETSGAASALKSMLDLINYGGNVAAFGIPNADISINWQQVIFKGVTIQGVSGRRMFDTWRKMFGLIESGLDISPILTHRFSIADYEEAFSVACAGNAGKILLEWTP